MNPEAAQYQKRMSNPFIFWWAMLFKLPSVIFWRIRIKSISEEKCEVTIPYSWRSQNPFKSIYFAALAGAAELSTGALCQLSMAGRGKFSMLVVDFRAEYHKKANGKITFACNQGRELTELIHNLETEQTAKLTLVSTGTNPQGEIVAKFYVTWSFKRKT
ncbi:PaaI family thioesterase [Shivajiella indica]|uniref:PaaI family thioesterase n=1 Tax=Shivajiella indica TaxID=872115 RepID=A0ABW5B8X6_9BACT